MTTSNNIGVTAPLDNMGDEGYWFKVWPTLSIDPVSNTANDMSGFCRVDVDLFFWRAPNFVYAPSYTLLRAEKDTYTYPTDGGWYWYDNEADAIKFFASMTATARKNYLKTVI